MTEPELRQLLTNLESDHVEVTTSTKDTEKFAQAICAFANDFPNTRSSGYLLIGVANDGSIAGLQFDDQYMAGLGDLRSSGNILPLPAMSVDLVRADEGDVAVITVLPSDQPPVRYKGRTYIRVGPRRAIASEQEERVLSERRVSNTLTFDARPCPDSRMADLAVGLFLNEYRPKAIAEEVIEENHREPKEQLASLRFFDLSRDCPTYAGVLAFGTNPKYWLPGAYVQFVKVSGTALSDEIVNEREITGDLISTLRHLDALVDANLQQYPVASTALAERTVEVFPRVAVRELLINGLMHRDYESTAPLRFYWFEDRIEIQSPGGLFGGASPENFPRQTSYRNPVIAEALKNLGYVNRYGRGVYRAIEALRRNGSPEPSFEFDPHYVLATIRRFP